MKETHKIDGLGILVTFLLVLFCHIGGGISANTFCRHCAKGSLELLHYEF
jgi:hypothetical protein